MFDHEVQQEVWNARLPVAFTLAAEEFVFIEPVNAFYAMVQRISYFPVLSERIMRFFSKVNLVDSADNLWLECNGVPLKWHYPVGVLYDLCGRGGTDDALPWHITVHAKDFPEDEVLRFSTKEALEAYFFQTVKEADQLKHRGEIISKMQKMEQKSMWNALLNDKFEQFWATNSRLMEDSTTNPMKHLPIRVYRKDQSFTQRLVSANNDDGQANTVQDMLKSFFPKRTADVERLRVLCQSVLVPHCTPLLWLYVNMSYPDNFVHLCISED